MSIPQEPPPAAPPLQTKRPGGEMRSAAGGSPTRSQLLPFGSEWQELIHKPYFLPGLFSAAALAGMWALMGRADAVWTVDYRGLPVGVPLYTMLLALCLCAGGAFAVYRMAGKPKVWWLMPLVAVATALLVGSPVMGILQGIFSLGVDPRFEPNVVLKFVKMFFMAGLPEELLKAIPVLIGALIGARLAQGRHTVGPLRQFAVYDPLDGLLIGAAAGFGFAFAETMFQYVPRIMLIDKPVETALALRLTLLGRGFPNLSGMDLPHRIGALYSALASVTSRESADMVLRGILAGRSGVGLELMIPRLFANLFGHAAYAGIFGYFIGLAVLKPENRVKTFLTGLAIAATTHALWNSLAGVSDVIAFFVAALAFCGLAVCIMKARKISPDHSQLVPSQIVEGRPAARPMAAPMVRPQAPQAAAPAAFAPMPAAAAVTPREMPASVTWDDESGLRTIEIGSVRLPATLGAKLYEAHVPGVTASRGDGVIAEVTANPKDPAVLGLRNLSGSAWAFSSAGREERELAPGRSIRLEAGMRIRIGESLGHVR